MAADICLYFSITLGKEEKKTFFWGYTVNTLQIEQLFGK